MATKKAAAQKEINAVAVRKKLGMNQGEFWSRVGVTQSGGSRYESGRAIPKPVRILLVLAYGGADADKAFAALKHTA